jgi:SpoVK/Ycf46/Vps4 family AAA+-type ATPase
MLGEWAGPDHERGLRPWRALSTDHTRDELVLPPAQLETLRTLVVQVREARAAGIDGERDQAAVVALFAGEAGTGKTLAAQIVAAELRAPILEVDTPAALAHGMAGFAAALWSVFQEGGRAGAVLVFHDAGAYLAPDSGGRARGGSRAEPVDLPARCARYPGLAIMCSRVRPPSDRTWLERFSAVVEFPFPDDAARVQLWRHALAPGSELDADELAFVARRFRLPGSTIHELAASASASAAEHGRAPNRGDLGRALEMHYQKALASQATQSALAHFLAGAELSDSEPPAVREPSGLPEAGPSLRERWRWSRRDRDG